MLQAGQNLRGLREGLGLTMRDVESASSRIADRHRNEEFLIAPSRLSDIETKGLIPSIYRIYALAVIYRRDMREILSWYGVDVNDEAADLALSIPPKSHRSETLHNATVVQMPVRLDPAFDTRRTMNVGRMIEQWGPVPLTYLSQFANDKFTYGYVGSEDFTMYPILPPGTFLQIDESRSKVTDGYWRSEYERPIYFVETRDGHTCCWCNMRRENLILQPHPLSPVAVRVLRHPQEAEVIGQVVGVAMRLGEWQAVTSLSDSKERAALS
ncbi:MAG TPA: helix-turn-helix transcriptional regulator [Terriglobales bacterium]|nr:helix-turn-helix transcriptional regulator [Terriglobales bacterium]